MIESTNVHGWKLYHQQKKEAPPLISLRLLFPKTIPKDKIGLHYLYNRLLLTRLQEASDRFTIAGDIAIGAGHTHRLISIDTLQEDLEPFFSLLFESIAQFEVSTEELEIERMQLYNERGQEKSQVKILLEALGQEKFYGSKHPLRFDLEGSQETIEQVTTSDLLLPNSVLNGSIITVSSQSVQSGASQLHKLLPKQPPNQHIRIPKPQTEWGSFILPFEGNEQSQILFIRKTLPHDHPLSMPMKLGLLALTSIFNSRLNKKLRKEEGLTYGVQAYNTIQKEYGYLSISLSVDSKNIIRAKDHIQSILNYCTEDWTPMELEVVKKQLRSSVLQSQTTCARIADQLEIQLLKDQTPINSETILSHIQNTTLSQVEEAMHLFASSPKLDLYAGVPKPLSESLPQFYPQKYI